jgi:uncharacterized protein YcbK (DUF882 family)
MTQVLSPRRRLLLKGLGLTAAMAAPALARAGVGPERELALDHTHTGEHIRLTYALGDSYLPEGLDRLNLFLRDHYSGDVGVIDPVLFDQLHRVRSLVGTSVAYQVISGYRSPATNQRLRQTRGGGVASRSLHMDGRAIDIRLPGVPLKELRDAALSLKAGGVGYYPGEQFVHLDTGRVRRW